ncbi:MAG: alcohol dehydrogenase catalytic domain-containing protein [Proteobacteria bacterium]|nr:alcohol dehydrogenase catalytic domain-containing protein [Pseudomonadota bacterium]
MKAVSLEGPSQCHVIESPMPERDGDKVIIKVSVCGICGSDLHFWKHGAGMDKKPGLIMGHEFCGQVQDPGCRTDLSPGDRVTVIPINPCGVCGSCTQGHPNLCQDGTVRPIPGLSSPGGYAQYCTVRPDLVRKLPESITDQEAAMIEPASVALHAVHQADISADHSVLISGGGPVGLMCAMWAKQLGASRVALTEMNPFRLEFARTVPYIDDVLDAREPGLGRTLRKGSGGFDRVIETSASEAGIHLAITTLKTRGHMVLTGISYKPQLISTLSCTLKELTIKTAFGYTIDEFDMAQDYISRHLLPMGPLATRSISLDQVQETLANLSSGSLDDIKIMICPWL